MAEGVGTEGRKFDARSGDDAALRSCEWDGWKLKCTICVEGV